MPLNSRMPFVVGGAMAAAGMTLLVVSQAGAATVGAVVTVLLLGGGAEFVAGELLRRRRGTGFAHLMSGVLVAGLAAMMITSRAFDPQALTAAPIALMVGLYCVISALLRMMEVVVDGTRTPVFDALDVVVTLLLGAVVLASWREASVAFVGLVAGLDVLLGGASVAKCALSPWPEATR